jgi:hypothetical protein
LWELWPKLTTEERVSSIRHGAADVYFLSAVEDLGQDATEVKEAARERLAREVADYVRGLAPRLRKEMSIGQPETRGPERLSFYIKLASELADYAALYIPDPSEREQLIGNLVTQAFILRARGEKLTQEKLAEAAHLNESGSGARLLRYHLKKMGKTWPQFVKDIESAA